MSKMTKMQINKLEESLQAIMYSKVSRFNSKTDNKLREKEFDLKEVGAYAAKRSTKVFAELCAERVKNGVNYNQILDVYRKMPTVIKLIEANEANLDEVMKERSAYYKMLGDKKEEIVLSLYFEEADNVSKIIQDFKDI